jgi:hypothetical protein
MSISISKSKSISIPISISKSKSKSKSIWIFHYVIVLHDHSYRLLDGCIACTEITGNAVIHSGSKVSKFTLHHGLVQATPGIPNHEKPLNIDNFLAITYHSTVEGTSSQK